jgi:hypothetical protein
MIRIGYCSLLVAMLAEGASAQWVELNQSPTTPSARVGSTLTYDPITGVSVLFGGNIVGDTGTVPTNETWSWDGTTWNLLQPATSPPNMFSQSAVFDQTHGEVVVLSEAGDSTWTWDGSTWTQKSAQILPYGGPLAYDAARGNVVLFIGQPGQTWIWDGSSWNQQAPATSPPARVLPSLTYDPIQGVAILFGGESVASGTGVDLNDTWSWDGSTWTQLFPVTSPSPRQQQAAVFDSAGGYILMVGGIQLGTNGFTFPSDTWIWDGTNWSSPPTPILPPASPTPTLAFDSLHSQALFFGDICCFSNPSTWSSLWAWQGSSTTGTISITTNLTSATFTLTGPATYNGSGTSFTQTNAPAGTYTITYGVVPGYTTPVPQMQTLAAGGTISFSGIYTALPTTGTILVTSVPVGAGFVLNQGTTFYTAGTTPFTATSVPVGSYTIVWNSLVGYSELPSQTEAVTGGTTTTFSGNYQPTEVFVSWGNQPSLAADPLRPGHVVVGFNLASNACAWSESMDGGQTWSSSPQMLLYPAGFLSAGDPWVRFGSQGELYYSCVAKRAVGEVENTGVFVATSSSGLAGDFGIANPILPLTIGSINAKNQGVDHPSIAITSNSRGSSRLVGCWADFFGTGSAFIKTAFSDDGKNWSTPNTIAGPSAEICTIGGNDTLVAITWFVPSGSSGDLWFATSSDGVLWSAKNHLATVGTLVTVVDCTQPCQPESTTSLALSPPYVLIIPGQSSPSAVWQVNYNGISQVFANTLTVNPSPVPLGDLSTSKFLPGTGSCGSIVGAYLDSGQNSYQYTVWSLDYPQNTPIFTSTAFLNPHSGYLDKNGRGRRIGDYTAVDCMGSIGWAAWTDTRLGTPENPQPAIYVIRMLLPTE